MRKERKAVHNIFTTRPPLFAVFLQQKPRSDPEKPSQQKTDCPARFPEHPPLKQTGKYGLFLSTDSLAPSDPEKRSFQTPSRTGFSNQCLKNSKKIIELRNIADNMTRFYFLMIQTVYEKGFAGENQAETTSFSNLRLRIKSRSHFHLPRTQQAHSHGKKELTKAA